jgi:DNA-binding NarL/FixJ family response regulator
MSYTRKELTAFSRALFEIHKGSTLEAAYQMPSEFKCVRRSLAERQSAARRDDNYLAALKLKHVSANRFCAKRRHSPHRFTSSELIELRKLRLTRRECEVIFWITRGLGDAGIASRLGCAPKTVSKHVENLLQKLNTETRLAAACAVQQWLAKRV